MTTTNGGIKNADPAGAPPPPSNFDLYAGEFSCDDDISFENLLQLDNDIDKPQPSTLHQPTASPPSGQICRQPSMNAVQASSIAGSEGDVPVPTADTVVYLLTTSALRPPNSAAVGPGYDTVARNNVRPLLRFQISKKPITTAVAGYELGGPVVTAVSTSQQQVPGALALQTAIGCDLASITSIGERVAAVPVRCPPTSSDPRCFTLTSAFNGELPAAAQRSLAAVGAATLPGTRSSKPTHAPSSAVSSSKSRSAAAADARQTVQEKNAYEYERVMDILRYYRELVVERKLPGACLPCKRRKSKPLVSADTVTPVSTRSAPLPPPAAPLSTTIAAARPGALPANQYVRTIAVSTWRGPSAPVLCLTTSGPATAAGMETTTVSSLSNATNRLDVPISGDTTAMTAADHDDATCTPQLLADDSPLDELPSRPSSVELGTARSQSLLDDDLPDCTKDLSRTCRSAPGLCNDDDDEFPSPLTTVSNKTTTTLECRRAQMDVFNCSRRYRTRRRSVDLRRFVGRTPALRHRDPNSRDKHNASDSNSGQAEEKPVEVSVWVKPVAMLPVKDITTRTTDTIVVKWTKAHLAIAGPYQSWT